MGTNYYAHIDECPHCNRCDPSHKLHIGKKSHGWPFNLQALYERDLDIDLTSLTNNEVLTDISSWKILLSNKRVSIRDEYGELVPLTRLLEIISDNPEIVSGYFS